MLLHIAIVVTWTVITVSFYVLLGVLCLSAPREPWVLRLKQLVRPFVRRFPLLWYGCLFLGTIVINGLLLWLAVRVGNARHFSPLLATVPLIFSMGYCAFGFTDRRSLVAIGACFILGIALAGLVNRWQNWITFSLAAYILAVPVISIFRHMGIRTAMVLLAGLAVHDAIHVFGTHWMDTLMEGFRATPYIMTLPSKVAIKTAWYFRLGFGDLVVPGILVVTAVRISHRRGTLWPAFCTSAGAFVGFLIGIKATLVAGRPMPELIFLVPCVCLGYGISLLPLRKQPSPIPLDAPAKA